ncbi:DUF488 domain-containing protein [Actinopolyspora erythraea]|uniref:DNA repair protein n=1 Tax=Actinopolyspora erythraea TaxID=414996 RepID=A0A099D8V8_9ACTN|nr:DUF488 domain-containing protein [Actinopolyspora erythraea]ASU81274.1 DUF488 domain-containing protein [Actinopolyspora erythraea]KGI82247.1 DNA repair protein [Actinopolyspora erythraea]
MRLVTVGHGTSTRVEFGPLLRAAGIEIVLDVRSAPGSRHNPDFNRSELQAWLPEAGVEYRWDERLGGFRRTPVRSPDTACRNEGFRAYAAHMRTEQFRVAVTELLDEVAHRETAVMCSESVWWRCHRRMIADYVTLVRGVEVVHLMHDGELREHHAMEGVRPREDGLLVYDGGQLRL